MQYLHVHSMYSKGDSTVRPESVVQKIQELGGRSVTLTDHGTLMGIDPFMAAGKKYGINTIPGVEVYGENRTHLILVPKNYKGFQAISYAMRDANEHIEKVRNLTYPIMLDSILTEYFQDNTDVIATSACIQGPISYILLANHRIKSKAAKAQNLYDSTLPAYERYTEAAQTVKDLKNEISSLKKQRTADSKPLKPAFQNKVVKLEAAVNDLEPGSKRHLKAISDLEFARKSIQMAEKLVQMEDQAISEKESLLSEAKEIVKATKAEASKHVKAKKELEERYASLKTEEELYGEAKEHLLWLRSVFPNFYIEVQYHGIEREAYVMPILYKLARETDTPLIAANDAHILDSSENSIEARRIIRFNYFKRAEVVSPSDHELYLKTAEELVAMLSLVLPADAVSEAIRNTEVLNDCRVIFPEETHYPVVQSAESFDQLLEEAIRIPVVPNAVHNLTARLIFFQELIQRLDILLQVRVDGDCDIRVLPRRHHAGKNGALMPVIAGKAQARERRIRIAQTVNQLPGFVPASVVDEKDLAFRRSLSFLHQSVQFFPHHLRAVGESFLLIITGDNEVEGIGSGVHFHHFQFFSSSTVTLSFRKYIFAPKCH